MIKKILTLIFIINGIYFAKAQQPCGTAEYESYLGTQIPGFSNALKATRQNSESAILRLAKTGNDTVYRIPVVFHIVWNTHHGLRLATCSESILFETKS